MKRMGSINSTLAAALAALAAPTGVLAAESPSASGIDPLQTAQADSALPVSPETQTVTPGETSASSQTTSTGVSPTQLNQVQVTGTRIKQANLVSNAPITSVSAQEFQFQGTTRVEDLLNSLPSVFADQGANIANGSDGTATVNLRNLGANRTLVLIDGKRVQPGSPAAGTGRADLDFIPAAMVERVEVLTGGASSVYGADAVAGVVNFIMKKDFEGVRLDYQRSGYFHDNHSIYASIPEARGFATPTGSSFDGQGNLFTALMGLNAPDHKGNITAYASYQNNDAIYQGQRDFSACSFNQLRTGSNDSYVCAGSGTTGPGGQFGPFGGPRNTDGTPFRYTLNPNPTPGGDRFIPYSQSRDAFNFAPYNSYLRNGERYSFGAFGHYDFDPAAQAYTSLMFSDDSTNAILAPSGAFLGTRYNLPCNSPLLSPDQVTKLCTNQGVAATGTAPILLGRRNVEGGGRDNDIRQTAYRMVLGLKGDLTEAWSYDLSGQYGTTLLKRIFRNDFSVTRLQRSLNVTSVNGVPTCASVVDGSDPRCVPYNIFSLGGVTPAALNYLQTPGVQTGSSTQQIATASISGDLGKYGLRSPLAKDGFALVLGTEYRREYVISESDNQFASGDLAGQGGPILSRSGGFTVKEGFTEVRLPVVQDKFFAKLVEFGAAYRYSDYTSTDATRTYKLDGSWAPISDIRLRAGYNRAVRAPNVAELNSPLNVVISGNTDPCAGTIGANGVVTGGATAAQCARDPLIAANPGLYGTITPNSANQYNGQSGTNPGGIQSERGDTYTAGVVLEPSFVKDLSFTMDWYSIKIDGLIDSYGADNILSACYKRGVLCDQIVRNPTPGATFGSLWLGPNGYVINTTRNTGSEQVRGIDFSSNYRLKLSRLGLGPTAGTLTFDFIGNRDFSEKHQLIPGDPTTYSCNGLYGLQCGTPVPNWRHRLRGTYAVPTHWLDSVVTASAAWRYIGAVRADQLSAPNDADRRLPSFSYLDLAASISFRSAYTFRVGMMNVFDKDPPIIGGSALPGTFGNGNTFPQVYDALGRYAFAGLTLDF